MAEETELSRRHGHFVVKVHAPYTAEKVARIVADTGAELQSEMAPLRLIYVQCADDTMHDEVAAALNAHPEVELVREVFDTEARHMLRSFDNLTQYHPKRARLQWSYVRHRVYAAHKITKGDPAIIVGVIDSGYPGQDPTVFAQYWGAHGYSSYGYGAHPDLPVLPRSRRYNAHPNFGEPVYAVDDPDPGYMRHEYTDLEMWVPYIHGMATAGTIFAKRTDGSDGVAPDCTLAFVRDGGLTNESDRFSYRIDDQWGVPQGILWLVDTIGARIITQSWIDGAGAACGDAAATLATFDEAMHYAHDSKNCVLVACAGNGGDQLERQFKGSGVPTPAMCVKNITVGGIGGPMYETINDTNPNGVFRVGGPQTDGIARWADVTSTTSFAGLLDTPYPASNWGTAIDLLAAETVWAPQLGLDGSLDYAMQAGTSFSAPFAAGVVALILSANPALTNVQAKAILLSEVDPGRYVNQTAIYWMGDNKGTLLMDGPTATAFPQAGVVNAHKAVLRALTTVPANAGKVYAYLNVWGTAAVGYTYTDDSTVTDGGTTTHIDASRNVTTTLDGLVNFELRGYSTDPITKIELWCGSTKVYDGAPGIVTLAASAAGTPQQVKVVASTASMSTIETYPDLVVAALAVPVVHTKPIEAFIDRSR